MQISPAVKAPSENTLNRLILGLAVMLVVGVPAVGLFYVLDRHVDPGPTLVQRQLSSAEEAVRGAPNKLSNRILLAAAYMTAKRYNEAVNQFAEVLKVDAGHRAALLGRGEAYLALGSLEAARTDYQKFVDDASAGEMANVDPQLEAAYYGLGSIALKQDRPKDALDLLQAATAINRTDADALYLLGTAFLRTNDPKQAVDALRRAILFVPTGWCDPYGQLRDAYTALGDTTGAGYAGGMVAFCEGRPDEARHDLGAITAGPYVLDATLGLALIAEDLGDPAAATDLYSRVLALDSGNFSAMNGLNRLASVQTPASPVPVRSPAAGETN
jgi:tetratricopeptide (TPR) repeat protein